MNYLGGGLVQFIILLLPGLWAEWIYKSFTKAQKETSGEIEIVKAMGFAIVGYILATSFLTEDFLVWAGISKIRANQLVLPCQFLVSLLTTGIITFFVVLITIKYGNIPHSIVRKINEIKGIPIPLPPCAPMDYLDLEYFSKKSNHTRVAKIYNLVDPLKMEIGEIESWDVENNIILQESPSITEDIFENLPVEKMDIHLKIISLNTGYVADIVNIEESEINNIYDNQKNGID